MCDTFYEFFEVNEQSHKMDEHSLVYTACIAMIIFRELLKGEFIEADPADEKECHWNKDFYIPNDYIQDTQNNIVKHCLVLSYKHTGHVGNLGNKKIVMDIFKSGICTSKSNPSNVHLKIGSTISKYWSDVNSQTNNNFSRSGTRI